jgi:hypothetical protein
MTKARDPLVRFLACKDSAIAIVILITALFPLSFCRDTLRPPRAFACDGP